MTNRNKNWKKSPSGGLELLITAIITGRDATYKKDEDQNNNAKRMEIQSGNRDYVIIAGDCTGQKDAKGIISYEIQSSKDGASEEVVSRD